MTQRGNYEVCQRIDMIVSVIQNFVHSPSDAFICSIFIPTKGFRLARAYLFRDPTLLLPFFRQLLKRTSISNSFQAA